MRFDLVEQRLDLAQTKAAVQHPDLDDPQLRRTLDILGGKQIQPARQPWPVLLVDHLLPGPDHHTGRGIQIAHGQEVLEGILHHALLGQPDRRLAL